VRSGAADLALVFRHEDDEDAVPGDLLREPLARHPVRAVVRAGRPLPTTLADLRDDPWIAGCVRCRGHLLRCARRAGFPPDVRFATDDHVVVQRLVASGLGVALLPSWALAASTQPGVVAVDLPDVDGRVVETLARPDARRVPGVAALLAALRAAASAGAQEPVEHPDAEAQ
jgi:DNA-binding transcriptional LysR family regulator